MANLQLFAEGDGDDGGAGDGNGDGAGTGSNGADGTVTFDDFLKGEGNQAEFDRRVPEGSEYRSDQCAGKVEGIDG